MVVYGAQSSCSKRSAGAAQPSVLRGRVLISFATAASVCGVCAQVGALGEVLAQQAVGVLIRATLPGGVRVAEVDAHAGQSGYASGRSGAVLAARSGESSLSQTVESGSAAIAGSDVVHQAGGHDA